MFIAVACQRFLDALLHIAARIVVRQRRRLMREHCVRLQRQVVTGEVLRLVLQSALHILHRLIQRLPRQRIHQVEIDIVEMLLRNFYRVFGFSRRMDAPQRLQMGIVKTLDAERQTIYAGLLEQREFVRLHRTRVRLQRDLGIDIQRQQHAHLAQDLRNSLAA